jgi:predicted HTH domain antitoxin
MASAFTGISFRPRSPQPSAIGPEFPKAPARVRPTTSLRPNATNCRVAFNMRTTNANPKPADTIAVTIQMPKGIASKFGTDPETIRRRIIEHAAVEGYRSRHLSRGQVRQLLGLDWEATEEFLAQHKCDRHCDLEDLDEDRRNLDEILGPS